MKWSEREAELLRRQKVLEEVQAKRNELLGYLHFTKHFGMELRTPHPGEGTQRVFFGFAETSMPLEEFLKFAEKVAAVVQVISEDHDMEELYALADPR